MGEQIYKKIAKDFEFLNDFGFKFSQNLPHYVFPSILFKANRYNIEVGFNYEEHRFFVNWCDTTKRRYLSKETLEKIKDKDTKRLALFESGIEQYENILTDIKLIGSTYDQQLNQVRNFLLKYLQDLKL